MPVSRSVWGEILADAQEIELYSAKPDRDLMSLIVEVAIFAGVILFSCLVIIAFALAAPFVLAITALSGIFSRKTPSRRWKPANI